MLPQLPVGARPSLYRFFQRSDLAVEVGRASFRKVLPVSIHTKPPQPDLPPWLIIRKKFSAFLQCRGTGAEREQQAQIACLCREIDALKAAIQNPPLSPIAKPPSPIRPLHKDQPS